LIQPLFPIFTLDHLLEEELVDLDIAVVHDDAFGQVVFERVAINDVELTVALETVHHLVHALLELIPILLVHLHFGLRARQILVELLQVVVVVDLIEFILLGDLPQLL